jgi:glycosyltransferase involved in cell wall biosynthesis
VQFIRKEESTCLTNRPSTIVARRIALICVSLRGGGTERIVTRLANHLSARWEVSIVTLAHSRPFYVIDKSVRLYTPPETERQKIKLTRLLLQLKHAFRSLSAQKPDACLIFGEDIATPMAFIARAAGIGNIVIFPRGTPSRSLKGSNGRLNRFGFMLAQRIVVQTEASRHLFLDRFSTIPIEVIPNPIDMPESCPPISARKRWILNVGSIGRKKNQRALIRAFAALDDAEHWKLVFVGDGPERKRLEDMVVDANLQKRVCFVGEQTNVSNWLAQSRVFAFPSLSEGFPNALAEALASGCACLSYDCPTGPADLIEHDVNGLLVPNGDESSFKAGLQRLVKDSCLQVQLGCAARRRIREFAAEKVLQQFDMMLDEIAVGDNAKGSACD